MDTSMVDMSRPDGQPSTVDTGVSVQAAAAALGITERTVRRRIKRGDLQAYKVDGLHGDSWRVLLGEPDVSTVDRAGVDSPVHGGQSRPDSPVHGPQPAAIGALIDTIAHLREDHRAEREDHRAEVARLERANEALAQAAEHWQARFLEEHDRVLRLLPAPADEPEAPPARRSLGQRFDAWTRRWRGRT